MAPPGNLGTADRRGIPPGLLDPLLAIVSAGPGPIKRRALLEELERRGHRISLAGLNRALQYCRESGLTTEGPDGVRRIRPPL